MQNTARPRAVDSAKVIQVIETQSLRGRGTEEDPCRLVKQYWDFDGEKLAERDSFEEEKRAGKPTL
jgi:nuclear transport factor 2 (NTF2) superfamily protein